MRGRTQNIFASLLLSLASAAAAASSLHAARQLASSSGWPQQRVHDAAALGDLIARLPKAELHLHIEGTLEPELMLQLAARNNVTLPYKDLAEAKAAREHFVDLQSFLDAYQLGLSVLVTQQDFEELGAAYLAQAAANNITHVEIFFDAQSHVKRGVPLAAVMAGLQAAIDARRVHPTAPVDARLILCLVRELGEPAAAATLLRALPYRAQIMGLGLASTEVGYPPSLFKEVYATAGLLGLHKVAHAGEEGGPDYVWSALRDLGVQRVDHGIHALDDPALVQHLVDTRIPITLCPLSNKHLQVYGGGAALLAKLRALLSSGIVVTINSDDPAYLGGYVNANLAFIAHVAGLGPDDIAGLARASFAASFIPGDQKLAAYAAIRAALAAWKAEHEPARGAAT